MQAFASSWPSELESIRKLLKHVPKGLKALEVWCMADRPQREALKQELQERFPGVQVEVLSSYKPLLNFVLDQLWEDWQANPPQMVTLHYPVHDDAHPERFLLETYPLAGMLEGLRVTWRTEGHHVPSHSSYMYEMECGGRLYLIPLVLKPFSDVYGQSVLRPKGQVKFVDRKGQVTVKDFKTNLEEVWDAFMKWMREQPWPAQAPFFGQLRIEASLPYADAPVPFDLEHQSLTEALSEEFYFGVLEFFQKRLKAAEGTRHLQPGQVVPVVRQGEPSLRIEVLPLPAAQAVPTCETPPDLRALTAPLSPAQLRAVTLGCGAEATTGQSVQGCDVAGFTRPGAGRGVLITAGQHANETTGVAAALRAVQELQSPLPLGIIPCENPDGYALHAELCQHAPAHMHHAARYTALGDDLSFRRESTHEKAVRDAVRQAVNASLHINLHGYPAHEWTRPLTGYVPSGFASWTLPKGFMLIVRHQPDHAAEAQDLLEHVTQDLAGWPELMGLNALHLQGSEGHTASRPYKLLNGTPTIVQESQNLSVPLELITEFPDETIYGERFALGVEAQWRVMNSAVAWAESKQADD